MTKDEVIEALQQLLNRGGPYAQALDEAIRLLLGEEVDTGSVTN